LGRAASPRAPRATGFRALALAAGIVALAGCGPSDPLDLKVSAEDTLGFSMWRSHAAGALSPDQLGDFDQAVQAIRIRVMSVGQTSGGAGIEQGMLAVVDGKTVREVLRTGLGWKLQLADAERRALEDSLGKNARLRTRPGDTDSAHDLEDLRDRQQARLKAATGEIARIRARLAAAGLPADPPGRLPGSGP
jgi:hypothetical protein